MIKLLLLALLVIKTFAHEDDIQYSVDDHEDSMDVVRIPMPADTDVNLATTIVNNTATDCPNENLDIVQMYQRQRVWCQVYRDMCALKFLRLCKLNGTDLLLLYGSIYNGNRSEKAVDFQLLRKLNYFAYFKSDAFTFQVMIRLASADGIHARPPSDTHNWWAKLDKKRYNVSTFNQSEMPLGPPLSYTVGNQLHTLKLSRELMPFAETSYMIMCLDWSHSQANCTPVLSAQGGVSCYCTRDAYGFGVALTQLMIIWAIIIGILLYHRTFGGVCGGARLGGPEVQFNMMMCMPGQSTREYLAIFRVGPASANFVPTRHYVDLQLLADDEQRIGTPIRYTCARFAHPQMATELHMIICRISPLPRITALRMHHSDPYSLLYLHEFMVVDLRNHNAFLQDETMCQFITAKPTVFHPQKPPSQGNKTLNSLSNRPEPPWMSLISIMSLELIECVLLCAFVVGLVSTFTMTACVKWHYVRHYKDSHQVMREFALCVLGATGLTWLVVALIEAAYLLVIKRPYLIECNEQVISHEQQEVCLCFGLVRIVLLTGLTIAGVALTIHAVNLAASLDLISGLLWSGTNLTALALTLGGWLLVNDCLVAHLKIAQIKRDFTRLLPNSSDLLASWMSKDGGQISGGRESDSAYMPLPPSGGMTGEQQKSSDYFSNYGPNMQNPNFRPPDSYVRYMKTRESVVKNARKTAGTGLVVSEQKTSRGSSSSKKQRQATSDIGKKA